MNRIIENEWSVNVCKCKADDIILNRKIWIERDVHVSRSETEALGEKNEYDVFVVEICCCLRVINSLNILITLAIRVISLPFLLFGTRGGLLFQNLSIQGVSSRTSLRQKTGQFDCSFFLCVWNSFGIGILIYSLVHSLVTQI